MSMNSKTTRELVELGTTEALAELTRRRENRAAKLAASGSKKDGKLLQSLDTAIAAFNAPAPAPVAAPTPVAQPSAAAAFTFVDVLKSMTPEQISALTPATIAELHSIYG